MKVQMELWKVMEDDPRWFGLDDQLAPTKFNPDRYAGPVLSDKRALCCQALNDGRSKMDQWHAIQHCILYCVRPLCGHDDRGVTTNLSCEALRR